MLALFQRKRSQPPEPAPAATPKGLTRPEPAASLLATPRRQRLLEHIWQRTSLSRQQFISLYRKPLERYAELVQLFPASESHHHAYTGGMLDHGLEIVAYALKLRQLHLLPVGTTPEDQAAQAEAWTAATAYAALLHDIGKIAVDLHVELEGGSTWHPWHGPLTQPYRFRYREDREYRLHSAATGLLYTQVLDGDILDWLSGYPALWASLLYVLAGQYEHAGVLGELVSKADQASVAQALGGDPAKAMAAPKHALQRKLLEGLRYLLREELKLNQPQASDGWLTDEALWLVSKTVSDKLRAHLLSQGIDGIPANNTAVFNVLQDHGMLQPTADGKAIWKATVTSDKGWSHSFTLLRLAPALIWEAGERPASFSGTVVVDHGAQEQPAQVTGGARPSATVLGTEPQDAPLSGAQEGVSQPAIELPHQDIATDVVGELLAMLTDEASSSESANADSVTRPHPGDGDDANALAAEPSIEQPTTSSEDRHAEQKPATATPSAEHFLVWLRTGIQSRKLIINDAKALVHTVADTVYLVSPGLFQRYAQEHPQTAFLAKQTSIADWQWIQKRFEKLLVHRKQSSGLNIWTCEVTGPRKSRRLHGYLLEDPKHLFEEVPPNNPYLRVL
ncbi:MobH family relaxase [Pseudomonas sp. FME51]|uniref:MobH family relaxase n=1 Tax=Pseudomonas sp. FME51 TaxID=2742609 RepID=UPI00186619A2|nr:MobH family relaxase [Pseudomonas sp. FME51]